MRLIALALAAALGTGCIVTSDDPATGDATFSWRFSDYDGVIAGDYTALNSGCGAAGVTDVYIEIYRGSTLVYDDFVPCESSSGVPFAGVTGLDAGTYDYWLTGYRLNDPVFEGSGVVTVRSNDVVDAAATLDVLASAPLTLYYKQNGTFSCAGTPWVYYAVYSNSGYTNLVDSQTIACDSNAFGFSLPTDLSTGFTYYVDFMQLLSSGLVSQYEACSVPVRHTGFPYILDLSPAPGGGC